MTVTNDRGGGRGGAAGGEGEGLPGETRAGPLAADVPAPRMDPTAAAPGGETESVEGKPRHGEGETESWRRGN